MPQITWWYYALINFSVSFLWTTRKAYCAFRRTRVGTFGNSLKHAHHDIWQWRWCRVAPLHCFWLFSVVLHIMLLLLILPTTLYTNHVETSYIVFRLTFSVCNISWNLNHVETSYIILRLTFSVCIISWNLVLQFVISIANTKSQKQCSKKDADRQVTLRQSGTFHSTYIPSKKTADGARLARTQIPWSFIQPDLPYELCPILYGKAPLSGRKLITTYNVCSGQGLSPSLGNRDSPTY